MADAGFKLSVEGEKEFKKAINEINAQIKANKAELKLLTEQYKLSDDGMERFTASQSGLESVMEAQGTKVSTLREQYDKMSAVYGENDTRVIKLKTSLTEAAAEYEKMNNELVSNRNAMEEYNKTTESVRDIMANLDEIMAGNRREVEKLAEEYSSLGDGSKAAAEKQKNLTEQNKKLTESMDTQQKKIDSLNEELDQAVRLFGNNSKEVEEYRAEVDKATKELEEMEAQIKRNEQEMSDSGDSANGLLSALETISEITGIEIPDGLTKVIGGLDNSTIAAAGLTGALVAGAKKVLEIYKETADWADELTTKSQEMSVDTEQYQALEYAATKLGVSMDTVQDAIKEINNRVGETDKVVTDSIGSINNFNQATEEERKAIYEAMEQWDELGVSIYDTSGELRGAEEIFYDLIDAYGNIINDTERAYKMNDMFGESYRKLNPLVDAGVDIIKKYEKQAYDVGIVMGEDMVAQLDAAANKWEEFELRASAAWRNFIANFDAFDWATSSPLGGLVKLLQTISEAGKTLFSGFFGSSSSAPAYATGTYNHPGGYAMVGEKGPEIVELPQGSRVYPTGQMPATGSTVNTYNIRIDASSVQEFNDIVRIVKGAGQTMRRG